MNGLALAGSLALLPGLADAATPDPKTFRDWMAGCDNVKTCAAVSLPAEAADPIAYLRLERPAGPDATASLRLRLRGDWKTPPRTVQLKLDGAAFPAGGKPLAVTADADLATLIFSATDTAALIEAARKATKLTVTTSGLTGSVSLAGSVAALLWIDEQQGRLNTHSALIRKGAATAVPAATPLPVIVATPASGALSEKDGKALAARLRKQIGQRDADLCEDDEMLVAADEAWPLDGERRLVGLGCSRGAYNLTLGFWTVELSNVDAAKSVVLPQGDGDAKNMLTNADFDPKTGGLSFFAKGRGLGDCGVAGSYAWTGSGFVQTALSMMGECRGIAPDDWITLYRSAAK